MAAASALLLLSSLVAVPCELWEFTSPQCGPCRQMEPILRQLHDEGVAIRKIDVTQDEQTARAAGVQMLPTFVVVADGQIVAREVGRKSRSELLELLRRGESQLAVKAPPARRPDHWTRGQAPAEATVAPAGETKLAEVPLDLPIDINAEDVRKALRSTVRLRIEDESGISYGTGTIIDVHDEEALVLTCAHIFSDAGGSGTIYCDLFVPGATPGIQGKLVSQNIRRDVGLVSLRPNVKVEPVDVGGAGRRPIASDRVFTVGCNRGDDPTVITNQILAVNRYHGPSNLVVGGRPVDGRSGGGLFAKDGTLIGVCNAADQEEDEGLYAALGPIHAELDTAGLGFIYRPSQPAVASREMDTRPDAIQPGAPAAALRDRQDIVPSSERASQSVPAAGPDNSRSTIPGAGQLAKAPPSAEVICIVRTNHGSKGSQVYVLDRPSPVLMQQLSSELNRRGPHAQTGLRDERQPAARAAVPNGRQWNSAMPSS